MGCTQGGLGSLSPKRVITTKSGELVRINVLFELAGCWSSQTRPYAKQDMEHVPPELEARGVSQEKWQYYTKELIMVLATRKGCCFSCVPLYFCCQCAEFKNEVMNTDGLLREWQENFNKQSLERLGIFCKTQSYCMASYDKNGKHRHFAHWIAFSLTPEDIEKLKREPHLSGDIENNTCCNGVNENELSVHPL